MKLVAMSRIACSEVCVVNAFPKFLWWIFKSKHLNLDLPSYLHLVRTSFYTIIPFKGLDGEES